MSDTNRKLAAVFSQMAEVMQILGADRFRLIAFERAARVLDELVEDVAAIGPDVAALSKIEGIGKGTAQRIAGYLETGRLEEHESLLAQVPPGLLSLLDISGLGPKTIALLWKKAGVESLDDLKAKLAADELGDLPGFGKKKAQNLLKSISFAESVVGRVRLGQAMPLALDFVEALGAVPGVRQVTHAGSLRRGRETIGDLDLIVAADPNDAAKISDAFIKFAPVTDVLVKGATKTSVRTADNIQVDLRIVAPGQFGAALMYFTGSKEHNIAMRQRAIDRGMRLNEYALLKNDVAVAAATEQEVFAALGLAWVPPELREDRGELAQAESGELPKLIEVADVGAELHAHTTASDGRWSIRDLALAAAARGFHTVAVTDHSKSQAQANGLSAERLEKHIKAIHEVRDELKGTIAILAGSEVDILADGSLDYPESLLNQLDLVVASPHAALSQEPAKATSRLIRALEHPSVTILGHPTGRIINRREGLSPDMKKIVIAAAACGTALEINANHYRLDLRDAHARLALDAGVKLAINTDAHGPGDLDQLHYGILTARRAGATAADVVNCMDRAALRAWIDRST
jgi:DNA polymerase (family 10)